VSGFVIPASARELEPVVDLGKCRAQCPDQWTIECELQDGHDGQHRNNMVVFQLPQPVYVGGQLADTTTETEHWQGGEVRLSWQEPTL
jgi:hypothetical protein